MIELKGLLAGNFKILFPLGLFFLMHFSYYSGMWPSISLLFVAVLAFCLLFFSVKTSFILIFCFSLLSNGFALSSGIVVEALLYLIFGLRLLFLSLIKKAPLEVTNCILIIALLIINLIHMQLTDVSSVARVVVRFFMLLFFLSSKEFFFLDDEKRLFSHLAFGSVCIFAFFAFLSGAEIWGVSGYLDKIEGLYRLGEEYREFGGADSLGYINCLAFPLILEQLLVNKKNRVILWCELIILLIIGILAKTSSFFISFVFLMFLFIAFLSKGSFKSKCVALFSFVLIVGCILFVANNSIILQQGLLRISDGTNGDISHGRFDIYVLLLKILFEKITNFCIGVGGDYVQITGILAHNVFLEILVCWGVLGFLVFSLLCVNFLINNRVTLKNNSSILYAFSFILACMTIGTMTSDKFYLHFLAGLIFLKKASNGNQRWKSV